MQKHAVIFADVGPDIGLGHLKRCMVLAAELEKRGWTVTYVSDGGTAQTEILRSADIRTTQICTADDAREHTETNGAAIAVIDSYLMPDDVRTEVRKAFANVIAIDDFATIHIEADIVINQNLGFNSDSYAQHVESETACLVGPDYALIAPSIATLRDQAQSERRFADAGIGRVLVSIGATDPGNYSSTVLTVLSEILPTAQIDVVLAAFAPNIERVRLQVAKLPQVTLHIDPPHMPSLILDADLAIGAGGVSSFERCCLGLPSIVLQVADNQRPTAVALDERGAAIRIPIDENADQSGYLDELANVLRDLDGSPQRLEGLSRNAFAVCNGLGARRICDVIENKMESILTR